jgi:hypothetical protein
MAPAPLASAMTNAALSHCTCSSQSCQGLGSNTTSGPPSAKRLAARLARMKPMTGIHENSRVSLMIHERQARPSECRRMTHVFFSAGWRSPS